MFKGQGQTTLEPSVLSTLYILIPWLLSLYRFCFYREDKPEFCTMGGIDVSETFLVFIMCLFLATKIYYRYALSLKGYEFRRCEFVRVDTFLKELFRLKI